MPSPFVGMDPYLEDPAIFPDLHDSLIAYLREALAGSLPEDYYAAIANRTWLEMAHRRVEPDVIVLRSPTLNGGPVAHGGGVAVAEAVRTEPVVVHVLYEERIERLIEIHAQSGGDRLVTTIEVLSRSNKNLGDKGRDPYVEKQKEMLAAKVNLVEIDLLRFGSHTTAVPLDYAIQEAGPFDYHVCVNRFAKRGDYFVYPVHLGARLPVISIPLLPSDADVDVDLQPLLDRCYDVGHYARRVRYRECPPAPALKPDQWQKIEQTLREKGLVEPPPSTPAS